jgi:hypothetical protein
MDPTELAAISVAKDQREQPWASLGGDYEERLVTRLVRDPGVLRPPGGEDGLLAQTSSTQTRQISADFSRRRQWERAWCSRLRGANVNDSGARRFVRRAGLISLQPSARHLECL